MKKTALFLSAGAVVVVMASVARAGTPADALCLEGDGIAFTLNFENGYYRACDADGQQILVGSGALKPEDDCKVGLKDEATEPDVKVGAKVDTCESKGEVKIEVDGEKFGFKTDTIYAGPCPVDPEICGDGIDNDCDGEVDDADTCVSGSITIVKSANPADGTDFAFVADLGDFTLDDADPDDGDGIFDTITFTDVPPGIPYGFTESVPAGWHLDSIICTYSDPSTSVDATIGGGGVLLGLTITLAANDDIECTFYNEHENGV